MVSWFLSQNVPSTLIPVEKRQKCPLNKLQHASVTFLMLKLSDGMTQNPYLRLWAIFFLFFFIQKAEREVGCVCWLEKGQLLLQKPSFIILSVALHLLLLYSRLKHIYLKGFLQAKVLKPNFAGVEQRTFWTLFPNFSYRAMNCWRSSAVKRI